MCVMFLGGGGGGGGLTVTNMYYFFNTRFVTIINDIILICLVELKVFDVGLY